MKALSTDLKKILIASSLLVTIVVIELISAYY